MKNVIEMFRRLREAKTEYIVMHDWQNMPSVVPMNIELLVSNLNSIITTLSLKQTGSKDVYELFYTSGTKQNIILHQTKLGRYPSQFETALLNSAVFHNDIVRVPEQTTAFWMLMYDLTHRTDRFTSDEKKIILPVLDNRTGPFIVKNR
jgi:hypothetical protein